MYPVTLVHISVFQFLRFGSLFCIVLIDRPPIRHTHRCSGVIQAGSSKKQALRPGPSSLGSLRLVADSLSDLGLARGRYPRSLPDRNLGFSRAANVQLRSASLTYLEHSDVFAPTQKQPWHPRQRATREPSDKLEGAAKMVIRLWLSSASRIVQNPVSRSHPLDRDNPCRTQDAQQEMRDRAVRQS